MLFEIKVKNVTFCNFSYYSNTGNCLFITHKCISKHHIYICLDNYLYRFYDLYDKMLGFCLLRNIMDVISISII